MKITFFIDLVIFFLIIRAFLGNFVKKRKKTKQKSTSILLYIPVKKCFRRGEKLFFCLLCVWILQEGRKKFIQV